MPHPPQPDRPKVGVAAFVLSPTSPSSILMGTRLSSHGTGTLQCPGGHLEHGETFAETAVREVKEETGLEVGKVRFLTATNDVFAAAADGNKHYVTIFVVCEVISGDGVPRTMEPTKCSGWSWIPWAQMWEWAGLQALAEDAVAETDDASKPVEMVEKKLFLPLVNLWRERKELAGGLAGL